MKGTPRNKIASPVTLWLSDRQLPGDWTLVSFHQLASLRRRGEEVSPNRTYRMIGMRWYAKGAYIKEEIPGRDIKATRVFKVEQGDFIYNRLFAWKGSFGVIEEDCADGFVSGEFPCFQTSSPSDAYFLWMLFSQPWVWNILERQSAGSTSTSRLRLKEDVLAHFLIPLPPKPQRQEIVETLRVQLSGISKARAALRNQLDTVEDLALAVLRRAFDRGR